MNSIHFGMLGGQIGRSSTTTHQVTGRQGGQERSDGQISFGMSTDKFARTSDEQIRKPGGQEG